MKRGLSILLFLIAFSFPGYGQTDSIPISTWKTFLHNNTNIGLTASLSHLGPAYLHPGINAKFFGLNLRYSPPNATTSKIENYYQWRLDLDIVPLKMNEKYVHMLSIGTGHMSYSPQDESYDLEHTFGLVGINRYGLNRREKFSFHAGINNRYRWNWRSSPTVTHSVILPYAEFTYTLYALKFRRPYLYHKNTNVNDYESSLYYTFAALGRYFNPAVGIGVGGVHGFGYFPQLRLNLGPFYAGFSGLSLPNTDQSTYQLGFNSVKFDFVPGHQSFLTLSWVGAYTYEPQPQIDPYAYRQTATYNSFLVGLNSFKVDSRFSFAAMAGVIYRNYSRTYSTEPNRVHPYGQLTYYIHAFKYRPVGYVPKFKRPRRTRFVKTQRPDSVMSGLQILKNNLNPRISLGAGMTHAAFFFPNAGIKLWRADLGFSIGALEDIWVGINADLDLVHLTDDKNTWVTLGGSFMGSWDYFGGVHLGLKRYKGRTAKSVKLGVGFTDALSRTEIIPSLDFSYHVYLFKMKFKPARNAAYNPTNRQEQNIPE